jgi:hypothetical protein
MIRQPGDDMDIFEEEGNDNDDQVMENQEQEHNSNSDH